MELTQGRDGAPSPVAGEEFVLACRNVTAYREGTLVFDGLDLRIGAGVNTAILGPNGSGKSTLIKLLSREIYPVCNPDSSLQVYGRERWNIEELRSRLGIVSNDLQQAYDPDATGLEVVLSGYYSSIGTYGHQRFSAVNRTHAEALMQQLVIGHLADRPFGRMSTGQQRRLLLCRALVHHPRALLLDEPTSGLDLAATFRYVDTIRELMHGGTQLILVTHHLHEIPPEITRVVFIRDGRIEAEGCKEELLRSERVSALFGYPVRIISSNGYYQAVPASA